MSSANCWFELFLFRRPDSESLHRLAADVASQCRAAIEGRTREKVATMGIHQMRGYVRAQAGGIVDDVVEDLLSAGQLALEDRPLTIAWATEQLIHQVVQDSFAAYSPRFAHTTAA
jgi:hypothetical protein